ncbi:WhiB family transcriptional regulator [Streptomyces longwoodensis]|uniref:WhiB family transcriptional regulator n=1 Tax=Streptomyces longwoodensis TaxID=68231 RepID=UPI00225197E4|nr:WhiB family transcriptional regulator [Streptomyces longwoodensis]MCX4994286.1 WhiB family transcriptional regulator [Streptomyces longwoodensis]
MNTLHDLAATTPGLPCQETDPELWHSRSSSERALAVELCAGCPIRTPCAQYALDHRDVSGVWGGTTAADRRAFWTGERCRFDERGRLRLLCGSERAYWAHFRYGEQPGRDCAGGDCAAAHEAHITAGRRKRLEAEHAAGGTTAGYYIHRRLGEQACELCAGARGRDSKARRQRDRAAADRARAEWDARKAADRTRGAQTGVHGLALAG